LDISLLLISATTFLDIPKLTKSDPTPRLITRPRARRATINFDISELNMDKDLSRIYHIKEDRIKLHL